MNSPTNQNLSPQDQEKFVQLIAEHQSLLLGFIRSSVSDWAKAQDTLQEVNIILWRKSAEFEQGTNFKAWALTIARFQILSCFRDHKRDILLFDDDFLTNVAVESEELDALWEKEKRLEALELCIKELPEKQRSLLARRYNSREKISDLATSLHRSVSSIKMTLLRTRQSLLNCVMAKTKNSLTK